MGVEHLCHVQTHFIGNLIFSQFHWFRVAKDVILSIDTKGVGKKGKVKSRILVLDLDRLPIQWSTAMAREPLSFECPRPWT